MKFIFVAAALLFQSSCAVGLGVRPLYAQEGRQIYEAHCNGGIRTMGDYRIQASEICQDRSFEGFSTDGKDSYATINGQLNPITSRSLTFACK